MTRSCTASAASANRVGAKTGTHQAGTGSIQSAIINTVRAVFHVKPWGKLVDLLGLSERVAKHRMAGSREFTADELANLLRSEHGFEFLTAVMQNAQPQWWRLCEPLMEIAEVQRMQAAARRRLNRAVEGAFDADQELTTAISLAEAFQASQLGKPHHHAPRPAARVSNRAVAPAAGQAAGRRRSVG